MGDTDERNRVRLRGVSAVDARVAWASGDKGTFVRTTDGGRTWKAGTVSGAEELDFRDVDAFSASTAYLLSIGEGEKSRIYKTVDGGEHWTLQFTNPTPKAFFDAMAFWDERNGVAFSDPVEGHFLGVVTSDGGRPGCPFRPKPCRRPCPVREASPPAVRASPCMARAMSGSGWEAQRRGCSTRRIGAARGPWRPRRWPPVRARESSPFSSGTSARASPSEATTAIRRIRVGTWRLHTMVAGPGAYPRRLVPRAIAPAWRSSEVHRVRRSSR